MVERGDAATVITTGRLVVRPWRLDEADRFFDIYRRPEVVGWLGGEPMQDRGDAIWMIQRNHARLAADPQFGSGAVIDRSSGVAVGSVILKALPDGAGEVEIGWQRHPDSWGNGFASEAALAMLDRQPRLTEQLGAGRLAPVLARNRYGAHCESRPGLVFARA